MLSCSTKTAPSLMGTEVVALRRQFVIQPLAWAIPTSGGPVPISGPTNKEARTMVRTAIGALALTADFPRLIRGIEDLGLESREP